MPGCCDPWSHVKHDRTRHDLRIVFRRFAVGRRRGPAQRVACDRDAESSDWVGARTQAHLARYPAAHIFHYAPYEMTALKRLAMKYATREAVLDQMLREKRFIDLYAVVRHGIQASTESYSLKALEKIYWGGRSGEVTNAGDSIVEYERYRELGDQAILDAIERYNEDDVVSTARLRDWLEGLRPDEAPFGLEPELEADKPISAQAEERARFQQDRLVTAEALRAQSGLEPELRELVAELLWFHQRSLKPQWWAIFDRQTWTDDELVDDPESLGRLTQVSVGTEKRSFLTTYAFPPQDTKLKAGDTPRIALTSEPAGTIVELDMENGLVVLKRGTAKGDLPAEASLSPGQPIAQKAMEYALLEMARRLSSGDFRTDKAVLDMLCRLPPDLHGRVRGDPVVAPAGDLVAETVRAATDLNDSCLIVQGPPGTGKTYTTARAIAALLRAGKRVAVSSNSHKAINNLLAGVSRHCQAEGQPLRGVKKASQGQPESAFDGYGIISVTESKDVRPEFALVGATAFELAKHPANSFDFLFVDEAGQVSLGNLLGMAGATRNLVLVGDQMQLPQPVQGVHPGDSGLSAMDYAMQDHPTVPPERGVLLNVSWRMHPDVCGFISEAIYEGRLTSAPSTARQRLILQPGLNPVLQPAGVVTLDLAHAGCTQSSDEEAAVIADLIQQLVGQDWIEASGETRPLTLQDILKINLTLRAALSEGALTRMAMENWDHLQVQVAALYNGDLPGLPPAIKSKRPLRALSQRLKGKQGRFRGNLSGKRVDFSSRTVISPDPNIPIYCVGVPVYVARDLTFPERVTAVNISTLRKYVLNGPAQHPGANYIRSANNVVRHLGFCDRVRAAQSLRIGDTVERHLMDGDPVLFNRQPSLHKMSIMCHRAIVMPWRTFRFNECVCTPYNADFDGDEMNLHLPQTWEARTEAAFLMDVRENLITPRSGEPLVAATQDFLTAAFLLTRRDTFLTRDEFTQAVATLSDATEHIDLPPPTVLKPVPLWTGKQVFNLLLRPNSSIVMHATFETKARNYTKGEYMCAEDGWVVFR
ncbi:MAG: TM0106 family RecB-like putative nuclease, partial [Massilia sp.]